VYKAIDKKRRGFLLKGQEQANGGNSLVAWERVQRPLEFGGLGTHNLELMGWALRIRWLWAQKTDPSKPWAGLPIQAPQNAQALFNVAVDALVGNGEKTMFWIDRWLGDKTMAEKAPNLFRTVSKRTAKRRTVVQALQNRRWVRDINGALTVQVWLEYFQVWDLVVGTVLQQDVPDQFKWKLTPSGSYSSKSAYSAFFVGTIKFSSWRRIWKSWAPCVANFSSGWWFLTVVGRPTALQNGVCHIRRPAPFAIRLRKQSVTFWLVVCLLTKSGFRSFSSWA